MQQRYQVLFSFVTGLVLVVLPGCRGASSVQVDVLEQELRQQEDYIYELEDYLVEYSEKLRQARCANGKKGVKVKSPTKPTLSEKILDDDDLTDEDLHDIDLHDLSGSTPDPDTPVQPKADTEKIPEPTVPQRTTQPTDIEQPSTSHDLEVPELKIEEPSATHPSKPSLPWSITDTELIASSAEESATFGGPLEIPDPVNYRSPRAELLHDRPDFYVEQASELTYEPNLSETETLSTDRLAADVVSDISEEEEIAAIDRIVIQQLLQNSTDGAHHVEAAPSQSESSPSSPLTTALSHNLRARNLLAVVEIRDLSNEPVEADGNLSLMVMAVSHSRPGASGLHDSKLRRLQRWDFSAEDIRQAWQSSPLGDGLHLELPMESQPLANETLELWARLVTVDGQKYLTKLPFDPTHLVALQDALLNKPEYGPADGAPLLTGSATRQGDNTMQVGTSWPRERKTTDRQGHAQGHLQSPHHQATHETAQWRTAQFQSMPTGAQSMPTGAMTSHSTTVSGGPPRWVAQSQPVQSKGRHLETSQTNRRAPKVVPRTAASQPPVGSTPVWKTIH
jgi:hypothetical protein